MAEKGPSYLGVPISKAEEVIGIFIDQHIRVEILGIPPKTLIIPWSSVPETGFSYDPDDIADLIDKAIDPKLN